MIRTHIQLDEKQLQALRQCSAETGRSIADLVREGGKLYLGSRTRPAGRSKYGAQSRQLANSHPEPRTAA
jgi:hypothetical protein